MVAGASDSDLSTLAQIDGFRGTRFTTSLISWNRPE